MLAGVAALTATGCWEQIDGGKWFPQMKRQIAVQAFEETMPPEHPQGFTPPEGTLPVSWAGVPDLQSLGMGGQDALPNPFPATLSQL